MFAFLSLLFVLMVIYVFVTQTTKEGFEPTVPSHVVKLPPTPKPLPPASKGAAVEPSDLPGPLPVAPYQQLATMSPLPYQDTTLIKANRQQLISLLEMMKGFLAFEAQEISEKSDPSIQLPLSTLRSDFNVVQSEVEVLNRNPGIQPNMTLMHLNEISSNLAFLQEKVRLIGAAGPIQGPIYEFTVNEGFQGMMPTVQGLPASKEDMERFVERIQGEILRLSASGTTDPLVQSRVAALTVMQSNVKDILTQLKKGLMEPMNVPIMKEDLDRAFPILGKPSEPLPQILKQTKLPAGLANALPSNMQNDPQVAKDISGLLDKYADTIVNGISASFSVKYTSPREATRGSPVDSMDDLIGGSFGPAPRKSTVDTTGFPSMSDLTNISNTKFMPADAGRPVTDKLAPLPTDAGRGPSHFDWKQRAKEIEAQVKKRGMNPADVGIMPNNTKVSNEFSWRGYARMICTRLQATMDPGLPETCGCPPMDWAGWRNGN